MKNVQSLQNWQFQSPNFHKITKLVPGHSKYRKVTKGPFEIISYHI
jgi:hypothetical protein